MTDAQSYRVVVDAVRALAGKQAVTIEEAWVALTGYSAENLDSEETEAIRWVLQQLGYEPIWVADVSRARFLRRWARGPWRGDWVANLDRPITVYFQD